MQPDTQQRYGGISRLFHWLMAAGFLLMLFTAFTFDSETWGYTLMPLHKSVGFLLLVAAVLRLLWAIANRSKRPPADSFAAAAGHFVLYLLMLAAPITAMIRQYGGGRGPLKVFGIEVMQGTPEKVEWMTEIGNAAHSNLAWLLFILAAGHIVMVIIHKIRKHDVLPRMLG